MTDSTEPWPLAEQLEWLPPSVHRHATILHEIETQADRGAVIVGAAYLDEALQIAFRDAMPSDVVAVHIRKEDVTERLLGGTRPLGTFSAIIDAAFAFGLYGPQTYRDLHTIRSIRNDAAHEVLQFSFDRDPWRAQCAQLRLAEVFPRPGHLRSDATPRERFMTTMHCILAYIDIASRRLREENAKRPPPFLL